MSAQRWKGWAARLAMMAAAGLGGLSAGAQETPGVTELAEQVAALSAQLEAATGTQSYVDNSYLFLIGGLIVMFMAAGFCLLEAGLVRAKNAAMQSLKNVAIYAIAGIMFWIVGYNLAYPGDAKILNGWLGVPGFFWSPGDLSADSGSGYAASSDWFFQMVFVATAASIVSGTVAERVKLWPFLIFTAVLTAFIYPVVASWQWGGGALSAMGFYDFAGSTLVHSTGGWAALVGALVVGPRLGKYFGKRINPMPGSNIPLAALGTFILWFGWFGFNGASQLAAGTIADINAVSAIFANTNMAACGGVLAAMFLSAILYKGKVDPTLAFNGAIGGLVSITASPLLPSMLDSLWIGAVGGVLVVLSVRALDLLRIDDVVGAIPAHLVCGIWGTLIVAVNVALTNEAGEAVLDADGVQVIGFSVAQLGVQGIGVLATGVFVSAVSAITWFALKFTLGVRVSKEQEMEGLDKAELGLEAYPEFTKA